MSFSSQDSQDYRDEIKETFVLFDQDKSGKINKKEVGVALRALGQDPSDEELNSFLSHITIETVTFAQFLEIVNKSKTNDIEDFNELKVAFTVFDREGQVKECRFLLKCSTCLNNRVG